MPNQTKTALDEFLDNEERARVFEEENLIVAVTELLAELMQSRSFSKARLAQRLGTSKSHITQLMRGSRNMTLRTLADMFWALDCRLSVHAVPLHIDIRQFAYPQERWEFSGAAVECTQQLDEKGQKRFLKGDDPKLLIMLGAA